MPRSPGTPATSAPSSDPRVADRSVGSSGAMIAPRAPSSGPATGSDVTTTTRATSGHASTAATVSDARASASSLRRSPARTVSRDLARASTLTGSRTVQLKRAESVIWTEPWFFDVHAQGNLAARGKRTRFRATGKLGSMTCGTGPREGILDEQVLLACLADVHRHRVPPSPARAGQEQVG